MTPKVKKVILIFSSLETQQQDKKSFNLIADLLTCPVESVHIKQQFKEELFTEDSFIIIDEAEYVLMDVWASKGLELPKHSAIVGFTATESNIKNGIEEDYLSHNGFKTYDTGIKGREIDIDAI